MSRTATPNSYAERLITWVDGPNSSINAEEMERLARRRILREEV